MTLDDLFDESSLISDRLTDFKWPHMIFIMTLDNLRHDLYESIEVKKPKMFLDVLVQGAYGTTVPNFRPK